MLNELFSKGSVNSLDELAVHEDKRLKSKYLMLCFGCAVVFGLVLFGLGWNIESDKDFEEKLNDFIKYINETLGSGKRFVNKEALVYKWAYQLKENIDLTLKIFEGVEVGVNETRDVRRIDELVKEIKEKEGCLSYSFVERLVKDLFANEQNDVIILANRLTKHHVCIRFVWEYFESVYVDVKVEHDSSCHFGLPHFNYFDVPQVPQKERWSKNQLCVFRRGQPFCYATKYLLDVSFLEKRC